MANVRTSAGVPIAADFDSAKGGPLVVNALTGAVYSYCNSIVRRIGGDTTIPAEYGAVGDGATDDIAALQDTVDAVIAAGGGIIDLQGKTYAISAKLVIDDDKVWLQNGQIEALASFSPSTDPVLEITGSATVLSASLHNVTIDGGRYAQGILLDDSALCTLDHVKVFHFDTYGIKAVNRGTELRLLNCEVSEFAWGETGYNDSASRTANGYWLETADFMMLDCIGSYTGLCFYKSVSGGGQITNCHFYSPSASGAEPYAIYCLNPGQRGLVFVNCTVDNAIVAFEDSFNTSLIGCSFFRSSAGNTTKAIELITSVVGDTCEGLSVIGCKFLDLGVSVFTTDDSFVTFTTTGSGSFASNLDLTWINSKTEDGVIPRWTMKAGQAVEFTDEGLVQSILATGNGGVGYTTGAGGAVTQATSKSTAVTINKTTGQITTHNASLGSGDSVVFRVNNSTVDAVDTILLSQVSGGTAGAYDYGVDKVGAGYFDVYLFNYNGGGSLGEVIVLNFAVIKGSTS